MSTLNLLRDPELDFFLNESNCQVVNDPIKLSSQYYTNSIEKINDIKSECPEQIYQGYMNLRYPSENYHDSSQECLFSIDLSVYYYDKIGHRLVGNTNVPNFKMYLKSIDDKLEMDNSLNLATFCIADKTASISPSMIYHQTMVYYLVKKLKTDVILENQGIYTPDIYCQNDGLMIEMTSSNTYSRLKQIEET